MNTLAFGYVIPAIRAYSGLAPVRQCSCRAYIKKASIPFREKMLAFTCLPNSYENSAKIAILFRLSSNIVDFFHQDSSFQPFHELQFSLEVLDKGSIIFHDSAQGDKLVRGYPFFIPITRWKSIQSPKKKEATESRIHKKLIMNIFVIPASQKWRAGSCIPL